jgi:hypothetical protein
MTTPVRSAFQGGPLTLPPLLLGKVGQDTTGLLLSASFFGVRQRSYRFSVHRPSHQQLPVSIRRPMHQRLPVPARNLAPVGSAFRGGPPTPPLPPCCHSRLLLCAPLRLCVIFFPAFTRPSPLLLCVLCALRVLCVNSFASLFTSHGNRFAP